MATEPSKQEWSRFDFKERVSRYSVVLIISVIMIVSWVAIDLNFHYLQTAPRHLGDLISRMTPPDMAFTYEIINPMIETINIAILGTILAIILALPVAFLGAKNTTPNKITYVIGKIIIAGTRSINVIIWALLFVVTFGPGALSGILAVGMRSIGFVAKLLGEGIEEIDTGQVEAIRAVGGDGFNIFIYGIVPQIKPLFVGITTYRWDINVRAATILGLVGAGGIGVQLKARINSFDWQAVLTILLAILATVIFAEIVSAYLRRKVS